MSDDLITWLGVQLDADETEARYQDSIDMYVEAGWPPHRVLAEVDAKRRILDRHPGATETDECPGCGAWLDGTWRTPPGALCPEQVDMALPYADRPGYREEWRP